MIAGQHARAGFGGRSVGSGNASVSCADAFAVGCADASSMGTIENSQAPPVLWCQCCRDAGCPGHMRHADDAVGCVVCGQQCQCIGCAANVEPSPMDDD
jgi:hypothetical protein